MGQNFTEAVTDSLQDAFKEAASQKATEVSENHLLGALLKNQKKHLKAD